MTRRVKEVFDCDICDATDLFANEVVTVVIAERIPGEDPTKPYEAHEVELCQECVQALSRVTDFKRSTKILVQNTKLIRQKAKDKAKENTFLFCPHQDCKTTRVFDTNQGIANHIARSHPAERDKLREMVGLN